MKVSELSAHHPVGLPAASMALAISLRRSGIVPQC
jgi:hypothetical protein